MPMIRVVTNQSLSSQGKNTLQTKLGKAISLIPGKSEQWLMVHLQDEQSLCFQGDADSPAAFITVKIFGSTNPVHYQKLSQAITDILAEAAHIPTNRCYIQYEECSQWAWNGSHF